MINQRVTPFFILFLVFGANLTFSAATITPPDCPDITATIVKRCKFKFFTIYDIPNLDLQVGHDLSPYIPQSRKFTRYTAAYHGENITTKQAEIFFFVKKLYAIQRTSSLAIDQAGIEAFFDRLRVKYKK